MSAQNDGGPAFPSPSVQHQSLRGMSLRDWFAGQALAGSLANPGVMSAIDWATQAYELADAMLAARAQKGKPE